MITVLNWDLLTPAAWAMANANDVDVGVGRSMLVNNIRHGREVVTACAMLCVGYILLYVLSVGIEGTVAVLAPYTAMLNIGVTMNRWMEVCSVLLNMIMTQTFDLVYAGFLAVQLLAAVIFSILYVLWMGWICVIRQRQ